MPSKHVQLIERNRLGQCHSNSAHQAADAEDLPDKTQVRGDVIVAGVPERVGVTHEGGDCIHGPVAVSTRNAARRLPGDREANIVSTCGGGGGGIHKEKVSSLLFLTTLLQGPYKLQH